MLMHQCWPRHQPDGGYVWDLGQVRYLSAPLFCISVLYLHAPKVAMLSLGSWLDVMITYLPILLCARLDTEGLTSIVEISDAITLLCQQVQMTCPRPEVALWMASVNSYRIYAHHSCTTSPLRTAKKYALQLKSLVLFVVVMLLLFLQPWLRICRRNHWRFSKAPCCRCNPFPHHHQTSTRHTHTVAPTVLSLCLYLLHPTHVASSGCCFWRIQMLSRHLYCFRVMTNLTKYCHCQSCFYSLSFFLNSFHQICYIACVQLELVDNLRAIADVVIESKFTLSVLFVAHLFWPVWPPNAQARMAIPSTLHHLMDAGIWMCIMNPLVCPSFEKLILPTGRKRLSPLTNSW